MAGPMIIDLAKRKARLKGDSAGSGLTWATYNAKNPTETQKGPDGRWVSGHGSVRLLGEMPDFAHHLHDDDLGRARANAESLLQALDREIKTRLGGNRSLSRAEEQTLINETSKPRSQRGPTKAEVSQQGLFKPEEMHGSHAWREAEAKRKAETAAAPTAKPLTNSARGSKMTAAELHTLGESLRGLSGQQVRDRVVEAKLTAKQINEVHQQLGYRPTRGTKADMLNNLAELVVSLGSRRGEDPTPAGSLAPVGSKRSLREIDADIARAQGYIDEITADLHREFGEDDSNWPDARQDPKVAEFWEAKDMHRRFKNERGRLLYDEKAGSGESQWDAVLREVGAVVKVPTKPKATPPPPPPKAAKTPREELDEIVKRPMPQDRKDLAERLKSMTIPQIKEFAGAHNVDPFGKNKAELISSAVQGLIGHRLNSESIQYGNFSGGLARGNGEGANIDAALHEAAARGDREEYGRLHLQRVHLDSKVEEGLFTPSQKLKNAEVMYGSDRSKWSKQDQAAATKIERLKVKIDEEERKRKSGGSRVMSLKESSLRRDLARERRKASEAQAQPEKKELTSKINAGSLKKGDVIMVSGQRLRLTSNPMRNLDGGWDLILDNGQIVARGTNEPVDRVVGG